MALESHGVQMENLRLGISLVKDLLAEIPLGSLSVVPIDWLKR
jgi:hypothetical protein